MKILITGSNGYVGNVLAEYFSRQGIEVVGMDLSSMPRQSSYPNFRFVRCDVRDRIGVRMAVLEHQPTHVLHLAYVMDPMRNRDIEEEIDVQGSLNVFDAAEAEEGVRQFVHFSSASVYGAWPDNRPWIVETDPVRPRDWFYAQNKVRVEERLFGRAVDGRTVRSDLAIVNLRMCTAVGPSYYKPGGVVAFLGTAPVGVCIDGNPTALQFIHEDDVKGLLDLVVRDPEIRGTYNLAPDSCATSRELATKRRKADLPVPKRLFKAIVWLLWHLRLSNVSPTSVNIVAHGIVISPEKLMRRYGYRFRYSTRDAFFDAYEKRLANGTL